MNSILDDFVTVAEAAKLMQVSPSTVWRWIDKGLLPAYRVGQRKVRVKRADLSRALTPARTTINEKPVESWATRLGPLTEEERKKMLAAVEASRKRLAEQLEQRGGQPFPPSWEIIREMREERLRQLP
jgi:excisionase family DNA binding protein